MFVMQPGSADVGDQRLGGGVGDVDEADLAALLGKVPHDGLADAAGAAGNENHLVLETG